MGERTQKKSIAQIRKFARHDDTEEKVIFVLIKSNIFFTNQSQRRRDAHADEEEKDTDKGD
jgi:hypothetical protein